MTDTGEGQSEEEEEEDKGEDSGGEDSTQGKCGPQAHTLMI